MSPQIGSRCSIKRRRVWDRRSWPEHGEDILDNQGCHDFTVFCFLFLKVDQNGATGSVEEEKEGVP